MEYTYIDFIFGVGVTVIGGLFILLIVFGLKKILKLLTNFRELSEEVVNNRKTIDEFKKEISENKDKVKELEKEIKAWKKS